MLEVNEYGVPLPGTQNIPFGAEIDSPDLVCDRIRRAQVAILHPDMDPQQFTHGPIFGTSTGTGFSLNSIVISIEGSDVIELSLVDLLGIIADDGERNDNVERVEKMAIKYIEKECNLILLVFHCIDDVQNQGARRLARNYDPESKRTITVLTKPDAIEPIQAEPWQEIFRASEDWFCVRQPGASQLQNVNWKEAREQEMWFFQQHPWVQAYTDPLLRRRLGTESSTRYLNQRLLDWIVDKLPTMQGDLRRHLRDVKDTLDRLPARVEDPIKRAKEMIWQFNELMRGAIHIHNFKIPHLVGTCRRSLERFANIIVYHLFPAVLPHPWGTGGVTLGGLWRCLATTPMGSRKNLWKIASRPLRNLVLRQFELNGRGESIWSVVEAHIEARRDTVREAVKANLEREKKCSLVFTCAEYDQYLQIYSDNYRSMCPAIKSKHKATTGETIHKATNMAPPYPGGPSISHTAAQVGNGLAADEDTNQSGLTNEQDHGIHVMAESRALYHISARRYAEGTAQIVLHDLLLDLQGGPELEQKLREKIGMSGLDAESRCRDFVEPPRVAIRTRDEFRRKQVVLKGVLNRLANFS
ncbi:hypothetical protein M408DRAFT_29905 [Serendipita vermifera MAFF 305830]|uniref:Uncharacterized protein n=1 Tax=Serendipita vermifera MAFF 305830 TaxID=933852 RepID=A0A0C3ALU1_SERVB|nr:hypothetical protein M408DRAFT_29905 [Serendipita vermifera MAFF 305830]